MQIYAFVKRVLDIIFSLLALTILSPLFLIFAILIKLDSKGPVFLKQIRMGKDMKQFVIYKFRTMSIDAPPDMAACLLNDPYAYITGAGKWLRKTSIDELPQLFNILKGNMSLVGPRPVVLTEVKLINLRNKLGVYTQKPGLTGWAQVNGRDCVNYKDKARLDEYYIRHFGPFMDFRVFMKTVLAVVTMNGVHEGSFPPSDKPFDSDEDEAKN